MLERKKENYAKNTKTKINRRKKEDKEEKHTRPRKKDWKLMTEVPLKEKRKVSHYFRCESLEGKKVFVLRPVSSRKKFYKNHKRNMPQLPKAS